MSKLQKFRSVCFAYTQQKGKLDPRCEQGRFIGYDKNSPAYLVYYPDTEKVQKHRLVKFTNKTVNEKETQTHEPQTEYQDREVHHRVLDNEENDDEKMGNASGQSVQGDVSVSEIEGEQSSAGGQGRKNPPRVRRRPVHLQEYDMEDTADRLVTSVDSCYRAICDIPQNYQDAIRSTRSRQWISAMNDEMQSLKENDTFKITQLPPGKKGSGG